MGDGDGRVGAGDGCTSGGGGGGVAGWACSDSRGITAVSMSTLGASNCCRLVPSSPSLLLRGRVVATGAVGVLDAEADAEAGWTAAAAAPPAAHALASTTTRRAEDGRGTRACAC